MLSTTIDGNKKIFTFLQIEKMQYTEWCKSHLTEEKIEYLHYGLTKQADFFINDRGMFKLHIHKDMPKETFC